MEEEYDIYDVLGEAEEEWWEQEEWIEEEWEE